MTSPIYLDNGPFFQNISNIIEIPFVDVSKAFKVPVWEDIASVTGVGIGRNRTPVLVAMKASLFSSVLRRTCPFPKIWYRTPQQPLHP